MTGLTDEAVLGPLTYSLINDGVVRFDDEGYVVIKATPTDSAHWPACGEPMFIVLDASRPAAPFAALVKSLRRPSSALRRTADDGLHARKLK